MNVLVVANPIAGTGRARARVERLVGRLEASGHAVECVTTRAPGDAERAAAERAGNADRIVAAGGDGTVNEVLNGLPDPSAVPLAHLALGTANMLARELGLPFDPEALAELVEKGRVRRFDLGHARGRRFLLVAGVGFDARVTREVRRRRRGALGYAGYAVPVLRAIRGYRAPPLRVRIDDAEEIAGELALLCNVRNYGGIFRVADGARGDSGALDVVVLRRARVPDLLRAVAAARRGRVARLGNAICRRARRVRVESDEPVPVQLDGDYAGELPVDVRLEPGVVPVVSGGS